MRDYLEYLQPQDPSPPGHPSLQRNSLDHLNTSDLEFNVPPRNPRPMNWPWNPNMNLSPAAFSLMDPPSETSPTTTTTTSSSSTSSSSSSSFPKEFLARYYQAIQSPSAAGQQQQQGAWAGHPTPAAGGFKGQGVSPTAIRALAALVLLPIVAPHLAAWLKSVAAVFDIMAHYMSQNPDPLI